ncbi:adaptin-binding domain-containing protein [Aspergillus undulatus]|uniref:adaptin-binding domain-containing protein n=1 Tax=Aspergillus undulatus TaxID=1810928 RepID=UPI003CCCF9E3
MNTQSKSKPKLQEIRNPRRLLILSPSTHAQSLIPSLLKQLTGHRPSETQLQTQSFAGYTTHPPLRIENRYYAADVPVWVDEIPVTGTGTVKEGSTTDTQTQKEDSTTSDSKGTGKEEDPSTQWLREFSSAEARVVRDAIGAVIISIRNPQPKPTVPGEQAVDEEDSDEVRSLEAFVRAVGTVRALIEEEREEIGSVPGLLVLGGKKKEKKKKEKNGDDDLDLDDTNTGLDGLDGPFTVGWWEDQLCDMGLIGFEVVEWDGTSADAEKEERNEYGEFQGMHRVKEVLETHEWTGTGDDDNPDTGLPEDDDELERELLGLNSSPSGFNREVDELQREMVGLRFAIEKGGGSGDFDSADEAEGDDELRVDAVEALLTRMRAIKGLSLRDLL